MECGVGILTPHTGENVSCSGTHGGREGAVERPPPGRRGPGRCRQSLDSRRLRADGRIAGEVGRRGDRFLRRQTVDMLKTRFLSFPLKGGFSKYQRHSALVCRQMHGPPSFNTVELMTVLPNTPAPRLQPYMRGWEGGGETYAIHGLLGSKSREWAD